MFKIILIYVSYLTMGWKAHVNASELTVDPSLSWLLEKKKTTYTWSSLC